MRSQNRESEKLVQMSKRTASEQMSMRKQIILECAVANEKSAVSERVATSGEQSILSERERRNEWKKLNKQSKS